MALFTPSNSDSSLDSSQESDQDFWDTLNQNPELYLHPSQTSQLVQSRKRNQTHEANDQPKEQDELDLDNLKKEIDNTIEKARNEVKSGLKKAKINARKEVEAEFEKDILAIKEKYGREINKVYELFESVKQQLKVKDYELKEIERFSVDLELYLSQYRVINKENPLSNINQQVIQEEPDQELEEIYKENKRLKLLIDNMAKSCREYSDKTIEHKGNYKKLQEEMEKLRVEQETELEALEQQYQSEHNSLIQKREKIEKEYQEYKAKQTEEFKQKEKVNKQQMDIIKKLQEELQIAKSVIVNPNINAEKVDVLKEVRGIDEDLSQSFQFKHGQKQLPRPVRFKRQTPTYITKYSDRGAKRFNLKEHLRRQELESLSSFMNRSSVSPSVYRHKSQSPANRSILPSVNN